MPFPKKNRGQAKKVPAEIVEKPRNRVCWMSSYPDEYFLLFAQQTHVYPNVVATSKKEKFQGNISNLKDLKLYKLSFHFLGSHHLFKVLNLPSKFNSGQKERLSSAGIGIRPNYQL